MVFLGIIEFNQLITNSLSFEILKKYQKAFR